MVELFKGSPLEVIRDLKLEIIKNVRDIKVIKKDFQPFEVEETKEIVDEDLELVNGIYQDLLIEYISRKDRIYVYRNKKGKLCYARVGDDIDEINN